MFDAYVRLSAEDVRRLVPAHLYSEIDADAQTDGVPFGCLQGFTEWTAQSSRPLSFGWDWRLEPGRVQLQGVWASVRTNLMVVDQFGVDEGVESTRQHIAQLMNQIHWTRTLANTLGLNLPLEH